MYLQLSPPLCFGTSRLIGASWGVTATTPEGASEVKATGELDAAGREYGCIINPLNRSLSILRMDTSRGSS